MPGISVVAVEAKATKRPLNTVPPAQAVVPVDTVSLPQDDTDDWSFAPSAGVVPSGVEINIVTGVQVLSVLAMVVTQVLRSKISGAPVRLEFGLRASRFVAVDVKETNSPSSEIDGFELTPFPKVALSGVDTRYVVGTHVPGEVVVGVVVILQVLRMYACGWMPSAVMFDTRFVASEMNATYCPSELITGL